MILESMRRKIKLTGITGHSITTIGKTYATILLTNEIIRHSIYRKMKTQWNMTESQEPISSKKIKFRVIMELKKFESETQVLSCFHTGKH